MSWREKPASESQLEYLKAFGFAPDRPMTKGEASDLLTELKEDPHQQRILAEHREAERVRKADRGAERTPREKLTWRISYTLIVTRRRRAWSWRKGARFETPKCTRERFKRHGSDSGRKLFEHRHGNCTDLQPIKLYLEQGHRFNLPAKNILQAMLDTLDADSATWDWDNPRYFFQTLEHNFPQLLRKRIDSAELKFVLDSYNDFAKSRLEYWKLDGVQ